MAMILARQLLKCCVFIILVFNSCALAEQTTLSGPSIELQITYDAGGIYERVISLNGSKIKDMEGPAWMIASNQESFAPQGEITLRASDRDSAVFTGTTDSFQWRLEYKLDGPARINKSLSIVAAKDVKVDKVFLFNMTSPAWPVVAGTSLQDTAALYYLDNDGLFASLDFPYSQISHDDDGATRISYPPFMTLLAGQSYQCHSLTIGAVQLQKRARYTYDDGMVDAIDSYIQQRFACRFDRPVFLSCSINNRYTQVSGRDIFYTWKDHPELRINQDLLKRELALLPKLGIEYYQVFPGVFDCTADDPAAEDVRQIVKFAEAQGVKMGGYSGTQGLFCGHYNIHRNHLDKPDWEVVNADGKHYRGVFCFGNPEFVQFYKETVVNNCRKYNYKLHCFDFLRITHCYAENHGHPAGADSIYHQIKGLTELAEAINSVSGDMLIWPNSGNWQEFLPKLAWWTPNLYLTDPFIMEPWQGLNMTRLMDDVRRKQMVEIHYIHFLPYRFFSNFQYFCCRNSAVPDIRNYQYGVLSTLAVCPNLSVGEIRPWTDELTANQQAEVIAFYRKWTDFVKQNFALWTKTYCLGDPPGMGSVEIYGHAINDHGFVFIVNPQYWNKVVEIPLDSRLGFSGDAMVEIRELYPLERLRITNKGPLIRLGDTLTVEIPAQQVLVLEVAKRPEKITAPRVYGLPGQIEKNADGFTLKTAMPQGSRQLCEIQFPQGSAAPISVEADGNWPRQFPRSYPTRVTVLQVSSDKVVFECVFRRTAAPTQLRQWSVKAEDLAAGLEKDLIDGWADAPKYELPLFETVRGLRMPMWPYRFNQYSLGPLANFCGGYIENAFGELQPTIINIRTAPQPAPPGDSEVTYPSPAQTPRQLPAIAKDPNTQWWLCTDFHLPFMYQFGFSPFFDDHTLLVMPFVNTDDVKSLQAWINGRPLEVRQYHYPRNPRLSCFYADLIDTAARGGRNSLVVYFSSK